MVNKKILVYFSLIIGLSINQAVADSNGYCAPSIGSAILKSSVNNITKDKVDIEKYYAGKANESDDTFSCSDNWTDGISGVSIAFTDIKALLKKTGEAAISKACTLD